MRTPGFSAEVVLDPAIQNSHYGGLFAGTSDQTGVIPQLELADVFKLISSKWVGFNWDPHNAFGKEKPYPDGYAVLPKKRLLNVQIRLRRARGVEISSCQAEGVVGQRPTAPAPRCRGGITAPGGNS